MDANNIITPTENLEDLDRDMLAWLNLPLKFKILADNQCENENGCSVEEYYRKIKADILGKNKNSDFKEDTPSNISYSFNESFIEDFKSDDGYKNSLQYSRELQDSSPYIIIIDPEDYYNKEILMVKYNAYISLNDKHRNQSDYYSWIIWGYNVYNMFDIIYNAIATDEDDEGFDSNIKYNDSDVDSVSNLNKSLSESYDFINRAFFEHDEITLENFRQSLDDINVSAPIKREALKHYNMDFLYISDSSDLFNDTVPWFTDHDIKDNNITLDKNIMADKYKLILKNSNKDNLLSIGWNPSVPVNTESIKRAKFRQYEDIDNCKIYNLSRHEFNVDPGLVEDYIPLYIIKSGNKVYISLCGLKLPTDISINKFYQLVIDDDNTFHGLRIIKGIYMEEVTISCILISYKLNADMDEVFSSIIHLNNTIEYKSIYGILLKNVNIFDVNYDKLFYTYIIDCIYKLYNDYCRDDKSVHDLGNKYVYILYQGLSKNLTTDINKATNLITHPDKVKELASKENYSRTIENILTGRPTIIYR